DEQLHPGTGPFEPLVDEARARPEILPFARRRPEAADAERDDGQQQIGEGDRREFLPRPVKTERGFRAVIVILPCVPPRTRGGIGPFAGPQCQAAGQGNGPHSRRKICSIGSPKTSEIRKASGSEGSYLPVSIALTLWRETPSCPARSCWLQSRSARRPLRRFFIPRPPPGRAGSSTPGPAPYTPPSRARPTTPAPAA